MRKFKKEVEVANPGCAIVGDLIEMLNGTIWQVAKVSDFELVILSQDCRQTKKMVNQDKYYKVVGKSDLCEKAFNMAVGGVAKVRRVEANRFEKEIERKGK